MKLKLKHVLIPLAAAIIAFIVLTTVSNSANNLKCDMVAVTSNSKGGKPAITITCDYKWSKMPLRLSRDTLKINIHYGWQIEDY